MAQRVGVEDVQGRLTQLENRWQGNQTERNDWLDDTFHHWFARSLQDSHHAQMHFIISHAWTHSFASVQKFQQTIHSNIKKNIGSVWEVYFIYVLFLIYLVNLCCPFTLQIRIFVGCLALIYAVATVDYEDSLRMTAEHWFTMCEAMASQTNVYQWYYRCETSEQPL